MGVSSDPSPGKEEVGGGSWIPLSSTEMEKTQSGSSLVVYLNRNIQMFSQEFWNSDQALRHLFKPTIFRPLSKALTAENNNNLLQKYEEVCDSDTSIESRQISTRFKIS